MPFGLCNGPSVFQRFINFIFKDLIRQHRLLVYIDYLLIATDNIPEHLEVLSNVFDLAVRNLLEFRIDKCSFLQNEIIYLGYVVNDYGIQPNPLNVQAVVDYPIPDDNKKLHRFLGDLYHRFL